MFTNKEFKYNRLAKPKATIRDNPCLVIMYEDEVYWIVKSGFKHTDGSPLYLVTMEAGHLNGSETLGEKTTQQLIDMFQSDLNPDISKYLKNLT